MTALIFKAKAALMLLAALALTSSIVVAQQQESVETRLKGFDSYMDQVLKDWNAPGIGIGIVMGDKPCRAFTLKSRSCPTTRSA